MAKAVKGFLKGVGQGFFGNDFLRDYQHASKIFRGGGYNFLPRPKFLFHVYFNLNTTEIPALKKIFPPGTRDPSDIGILVKTIQLPTYQIKTDTLNQYNRKRLIQTQINYEPCQITFHDDNNDLIRSMWYNYFAYYYKDPSQQYWRNAPTTEGTAGQSGNGADSKMSYNARDIYAPVRTVNDWGYIGESVIDGPAGNNGKPPFFRDITVYGLSNGPDTIDAGALDQGPQRPSTGRNFVAYVLINPLITDWRHDTYDYSQSNQFMEHQMTVRYETVKYYSGKIDGTRPSINVKGFADTARYDTQPSPLSRSGTGASVLGTGGIVDTVGGIVTDLQKGSVAGIIGAVQKAGTLRNTFKGKNLKAIVKEEATSLLKDAIRNELPNQTRAIIGKVDGMVFPKENQTPNSGLSNAQPATPRLEIDGVPAPYTPRPLTEAEITLRRQADEYNATHQERLERAQQHRRTAEFFHLKRMKGPPTGESA